mgnify:CR=1 FL=1
MAKKSATTAGIAAPMPALLIRSKTEPTHWSLLTSICGRYIEADIRPDTRRWIETHYDIAVHPTLEPMGETYDIIALTEKTATAPEKKEK